MPYQNIFQIWKELGEKVPFAVRRQNWSDAYYVVVEKIEIGKFPYGRAYGFPVSNSRYSDHFEYDSRWRKKRIIPNCGSYQWELVEDVELDRNKL